MSFSTPAERRTGAGFFAGAGFLAAAAFFTTFFGAARPLLDEARREALRTSFSEALPLGSAFEALFTAEERRDYALADFLDDVAAFRGRGGGGGMGGEEALAFLAFAQ